MHRCSTFLISLVHSLLLKQPPYSGAFLLQFSWDCHHHLNQHCHHRWISTLFQSSSSWILLYKLCLPQTQRWKSFNIFNTNIFSTQPRKSFIAFSTNISRLNHISCHWQSCYWVAYSQNNSPFVSILLLKPPVFLSDFIHFIQVSQEVHRAVFPRHSWTWNFSLLSPSKAIRSASLSLRQIFRRLPLRVVVALNI